MGSQKLALLTLSRVAAAVLTTGQLVSPTGEVATAGGVALGAATTDASVGSIFPCDVIGTTTLRAEGAITDGMELEVGTDGAATESAGGRIVAIALEDAADDQLFEALLIPGGLIPAA